MPLATTRPKTGRQLKTNERVQWDKSCPGLGLRIRPSGAASWIVQRRIDGRLIKKTLGRAGAIDRDLARDLARALARDMTSDESRAAVHAASTVPTLSVFTERFLTDCAGRWKPLTTTRHRQDLEGRIPPSLGANRVDRIDASDIIAWRASLAKTVGGASQDRALAVLSGLMRHAEALGLRPPGSNPCRGLRRRKTTFEGRALTAQEWRRLGRVLRAREADTPMLVALVRFIACRHGEAVGL